MFLGGRERDQWHEAGQFNEDNNEINLLLQECKLEGELMDSWAEIKSLQLTFILKNFVS